MKIRFLTICILIIACGKKTEDSIITSVQGGKGGNYNIAIFPLHGKKGISGKLYIQYASMVKMSSLRQANDSSATMIEPGFGPHAHFFALKAGYYAIRAICSDSTGQYSADTCIQIRSTQSVNTDINLQVK